MVFLIGTLPAPGEELVAIPLHAGHKPTSSQPVPFSPPALTPGYFTSSDTSPNRANTATGTNTGGIPYSRTMGAASNYAASFDGIVGARSWEDPDLMQSHHGRVRSSTWVAIELRVPANVTVSFFQKEMVSDFLSLLPGDFAGGKLKPAFTLYKGWQTSGNEGDLYNNRGAVDWATSLTYLDHVPNESGTKTVTETFSLQKGYYSLALGGANAGGVAEGRQGFTASVNVVSLAQPAAIGQVKRKYKTKKRRVNIRGLFVNPDSAAFLAVQQNRKTQSYTATGAVWTASARLKKGTNYVFVAAVSLDGSVSAWTKIKAIRK